MLNLIEHSPSLDWNLKHLLSSDELEEPSMLYSQKSMHYHCFIQEPMYFLRGESRNSCVFWGFCLLHTSLLVKNSTIELCLRQIALQSSFNLYTGFKLGGGGSFVKIVFLLFWINF